jgi:predicted esterase
VYGKSNVSTLGHSQGAMIASEVGKKSKEIIKLNHS